MWKALIAATAVGVIAGSSLLVAQQQPAPSPGGEYGDEWQPSARDHDEDYDWQPSAEDDRGYGWQSPAEHDQESGPHWQPTAEDMSAFMDARIAALKAGLRLTPDQEKNWPAFESAIRDMARTRHELWAMHQNKQPPANPVEWLQQRADALSSTAAGLKKLSDAEGPLYKSLDDAQKHRFEILAEALRPHRWSTEWRHDHHCGWQRR